MSKKPKESYLLTDAAEIATQHLGYKITLEDLINWVHEEELCLSTYIPIHDARLPCQNMMPTFYPKAPQFAYVKRETRTPFKRGLYYVVGDIHHLLTVGKAKLILSEKPVRKNDNVAFNNAITLEITPKDLVVTHEELYRWLSITTSKTEDLCLENHGQQLQSKEIQSKTALQTKSAKNKPYIPRKPIYVLAEEIVLTEFREKEKMSTWRQVIDLMKYYDDDADGWKTFITYNDKKGIVTCRDDQGKTEMIKRKAFCNALTEIKKSIHL